MENQYQHTSAYLRPVHRTQLFFHTLRRRIRRYWRHNHWYWRILALATAAAALTISAHALLVLWTTPAAAYELPIRGAPRAVTAPDPSARLLADLLGTPMEDAIPHIQRAAAYYDLPIELYLGIANAESSFTRFRCFNPWGIDTGRGNDPRCYQDWPHSVNGFSVLLKYHYLAEGKITPRQMAEKYVGRANPDWARNVERYYHPQVTVDLR